MTNYEEFLASKFNFCTSSGFVISQEAINPMLFPHQRDIVQWAVNKGRAAVPYRAIKLGRYGCAAELSAEYFKDGVRYLREAEREVESPTLFDLLDAATVA